MIVNCTTTLDEHEGMYWTIGNEIFQTEDEELFVSHSVPLSDWNVKAKCKIKLHESLEYSRGLEVILFSKFDFKCSTMLRILRITRHK